jgi:hypothetical protein
MKKRKEKKKSPWKKKRIGSGSTTIQRFIDFYRIVITYTHTCRLLLLCYQQPCHDLEWPSKPRSLPNWTSLSLFLSISSTYAHIYIYIYVYVYICIYMWYMYIQVGEKKRTDPFTFIVIDPVCVCMNRRPFLLLFFSFAIALNKQTSGCCRRRFVECY